MNLNEYQSRTHATAMFPTEHALSYLTLGLCSEIGELFEVSAECYSRGSQTFKKELGDVMWYVSEIAILFGIELKENAREYPVPTYPETYIAGMAMHAGLLAGKAKKVLRDGTALDRAFVEERLANIIRLVEFAAEGSSFTLEEVLVLNIDKLSDRKARGVIKGSGDHR